MNVQYSGQRTIRRDAVSHSTRNDCVTLCILYIHPRLRKRGAELQRGHKRVYVTPKRSDLQKDKAGLGPIWAGLRAILIVCLKAVQGQD